MDKRKDFIEKSRPLIKWLNENCNPHTKIIITSTGAELVEGQMSTGEIADYLKD